MLCLNCGRFFDHGKPENVKDDGEKKASYGFCSEGCMKSYA